MSSCVVAFSGGLDTSFLIPFLKQKYGFSKVITCTVNTGGFSQSDLQEIARRSVECGADDHVIIDGTERYYSEVLKFLIFGNVSRDGYPLCVGSERLIQASEVLRVANERNASAIAHGSTGAGNDQFRFDVVCSVLGAGKIKTIAPIREHEITREFSTQYLLDKGISVKKKNSTYSYNVGLWGVSIGGGETHKSESLIPEDAWYGSKMLSPQNRIATLKFNRGEPFYLSVEDKSIEGPIPVIQALNTLGFEQGIGRHYHVGTSIPGKKGRLAYESPAADLIYEAHRMLEKHVLSQKQIHSKRIIAEEVGKLIHEAYYFDPLLDDYKAFLTSSQKRVSGEVKIYIEPYRISAITVSSPNDLLGVKGAVYGESSSAYSGAEAEGACKLYGFEQALYNRLVSK